MTGQGVGVVVVSCVGQGGQVGVVGTTQDVIPLLMVQLNPASMDMHDDEQPSPAITLPSSHISVPSLLPFPHF